MKSHSDALSGSALPAVPARHSAIGLTVGLVVLALTGIGPHGIPASDAAESEGDRTGADAFAQICARAAADADGITVRGSDEDWLFLKTELAHLGAGALESTDGIDAVEDAIVRYHEALAALGVELLLVPVPPKAAIYPEKLSAAATGVDDAGLPAADSVHRLAPFYEKLRARGVAVLDLEPVFLAARGSDDAVRFYCEQDSHWTPTACEMAARLIHERVAGKDWLESATAGGGFQVGADPESLRIKGDLRTGDFEAMDDEVLPMKRAGRLGADGATIEAVDAKFPESPIILVGDSHTRVFQAGGADMHAVAGGLRDHLQALFGTGIDHHANNGSGADVARVSLLRAAARIPGYWDGKKLLVWCFSAREFTQGKWRDVPPVMSGPGR